MALTIASNISSLTAQNHLSRSANALSNSVERLSSGLKINRGADGPAALVISEKQRAQIAGLQQAIENSAKAVAMVQTAEGALGEVNDLLLRIRGLALDSANAGVNDAETLAANQAEINNALETIDRIASNTQFGTKKLLDGSFGGSSAVATASGVTVSGTTDQTQAGNYSVNVTQQAMHAWIQRPDFTTTTGDETLTLNGESIFIASGTSQADYITEINNHTANSGVKALSYGGNLYLQALAWGSSAAITGTSDNPSGVFGYFSSTPTTINGVDAVVEIGGTSYTGNGNVITATSGPAQGLTITLGEDPSDQVNSVTGAQGSIEVERNGLEFQIGANQNQTASLSIRDVNTSGLGRNIAGNQFSSLAEIDVSTAAKAQDTLAIVDKAISQVTEQRAELGAFQQNTLNSTTENLRTTLENTIAAESIVRDTDFASEIAQYTKNQVLVQAGMSILKNANQTPQMVLSLLN